MYIQRGISGIYIFFQIYPRGVFQEITIFFQHILEEYFQKIQLSHIYPRGVFREIHFVSTYPRSICIFQREVFPENTFSFYIYPRGVFREIQFSSHITQRGISGNIFSFIYPRGVFSENTIFFLSV